MRGPRALRQTPSDRNPQHSYRTPRAGTNPDLTAGIVCAFPHAAQAVPIVIPNEIESRAIVCNFQMEPPVFNLKVDTYFSSAGVPQDVMNSLFEDEEDLPP
jgi:hypothetical protein